MRLGIVGRGFQNTQAILLRAGQITLRYQAADIVMLIFCSFFIQQTDQGSRDYMKSKL